MEEYTEEILEELEYSPIQEQEANDVSVNKSEIFDYFILYHSDGWQRLQDYLNSIKSSLERSSKTKMPDEDLASYGAKRLAADSTIDVIDNLLDYVKISANMYNSKK